MKASHNLTLLGQFSATTLTRRPSASSDQPEPPLVAHQGVAKLAQGLYTTLQPYLDAAQTSSSTSSSESPQSSTPTAHKQTQSSGDLLPISFAGHSLGGAMCLLLLAVHRERCKTASLSAATRRTAKATGVESIAGQAAVHSFGAPPVLAHREGGGGYKVLQVGVFVWG